MFSTIANIFRIPELRSKIFFTLFLLVVYRLGFHVPLPGINQEFMAEAVKQQGSDRGGFGQLAAAFALWMSYRPSLRPMGAPTLLAPYIAVITVAGGMCFLVYVLYVGRTLSLIVGMLSEAVELLMAITLLLYAILNARAARHLGLVTTTERRPSRS